MSSSARNFISRLFIACLLVGSASADQWAILRPESIKSANCKVAEVVFQETGSNTTESFWEANAEGTRKDGGKWRFVIGEFPPTVRGRHKAEKLCSKFTDYMTRKLAPKQ